MTWGYNDPRIKFCWLKYQFKMYSIVRQMHKTGHFRRFCPLSWDHPGGFDIWSASVCRQYKSLKHRQKIDLLSLSVMWLRLHRSMSVTSAKCPVHQWEKRGPVMCGTWEINESLNSLVIQWQVQLHHVSQSLMFWIAYATATWAFFVKTLKWYTS